MARPHLNVTKALPGDAGDLSALWIEWALCSGMSHDLAARAGNVARITCPKLPRGVEIPVVDLA